MSAIEPSMRDAGLKRQIPAFAAVGAFGFLVDASLTYAFVRGFGLNPLIARLPAFAIATVVNFSLNRWLTFAASRAPLGEAFMRYCLVCGVGLAINWTGYALALAAVARFLGWPATPEAWPLLVAYGAVAFGTGIAMFATFFGFKLFAFRA